MKAQQSHILAIFPIIFQQLNTGNLVAFQWSSPTALCTLSAVLADTFRFHPPLVNTILYIFLSSCLYTFVISSCK